MIVQSELFILTIRHGHAEKDFFPSGQWSKWSMRQAEVVLADHG